MDSMSLVAGLWDVSPWPETTHLPFASPLLSTGRWGMGYRNNATVRRVDEPTSVRKPRVAPRATYMGYGWIWASRPAAGSLSRSPLVVAAAAAAVRCFWQFLARYGPDCCCYCYLIATSTAICCSAVIYMTYDRAPRSSPLAITIAETRPKRRTQLLLFPGGACHASAICHIHYTCASLPLYSLWTGAMSWPLVNPQPPADLRLATASLLPTGPNY
jgi:hypothetical protein